MKQYMCESCGWSLMSDSVPATCDRCGDCEFMVVPPRASRTHRERSIDISGTIILLQNAIDCLRNADSSSAITKIDEAKERIDAFHGKTVLK